MRVIGKVLPGLLLLLVAQGCAFKQGKPYAEKRDDFVSCDQMQLQSRMSAKDYYERGQLDSAVQAIDDFCDICPSDRYGRHARVLLHAMDGDSLAPFYNRRLLRDLLDRKELGVRDYNYYWYYIPPERNDGFGSFIARLARDHSPNAREGTVDRLLSDCILDDCHDVFQRIQSPAYEGTRIREIYDREISLIRRNEDAAGHFAVYAGGWWPQGNAKSLDWHPVLGAVLGGALDGFHYNLFAEWRAGSAHDPFTVVREDSTIITQRFNGYYVGVQAGRDLFRNNHHQTYLLAGAGLDGFTYGEAIGEGDNRRTESINTIGFHIGAGYRYYLKKHSIRYIGIEGTYHMHSYNREAGPGLEGNSIGVKLLIGWFGNEAVESHLRRYDYNR